MTGGLPPRGGPGRVGRSNGSIAGAAAATPAAAAAAGEAIRVTVRLRPVSQWEAETMPPPWPVQHAPGEVRIYAGRAGRGRDASKLWAHVSEGGSQSPRHGSAPSSPRMSACSPHFDAQTGEAQEASYASYRFADVFGPSTSGDEVYERSGCRDIVESALTHGCNGTIFLYGQTGSGKTTSHDQLTRLAAAHIFGRALEEGGRELARVTVSVVELYNETVRCLLTGRDVALRRAPLGGAVVLEGAGEKACSSEAQLLAAINAAQARRAVGETRANLRSSRSHLVVRVRLEVLELGALDGSASAGDGGGMAPLASARGVAFGVLNMVDLAGSERVAKTGSNESQSLLREALHINRSLLVLGNVVTALAARADGNARAFVPYRDSKLTRLLEDALGGSARTALVACATPLPGFHLEQTRATLDFAARTARVVCRPQSNVVPLNEAPPNGDMEQISTMRRELEQLRDALAERTSELEALRARLGPASAPGSSGADGIDGGRRISNSCGLAAAAGPSACGRQKTRGSSGGGSSALERLLRRASDAREARLRRSCGGWAGLSGGGCLQEEDNRARTGRRASTGAEATPSNGPSGSSSRRIPDGGAAGCTQTGASDASGAADQRRRPGPASSSAPGSLIWRILQFHRHTDSASTDAPKASARGSLGRSGGGVCGTSAGSSGGGGDGAGGSKRASDPEGCRVHLRRGCSLDVADLPGIDAGQHDEGPRRASEGGVEERKSEVRQLREQADQQAQRLAKLVARVEAARAEVEQRDARLEAMVDGVSRLGASRQAEMARVAAALARVESGLVSAQREAAAYQAEAGALRDQLTATRNVLLATGQALAEAKAQSKVTAALSACAAPLAGIQAALETIAAQPDTPGRAPGGGGGAGTGDQARRQLASRQLGVLDQLLPQVQALIARIAAAAPSSPRHGAQTRIAAQRSAPGGGGGGAPALLALPPAVRSLPIAA
ncbi:hypothetical protein Rsub_08802 [Raphidocelis subcapitata]|uniref:Kinesin-like protein n=1 Tax=Raphidocelis subcapitata TaxID=307507 RepID=A0A2V0PFK5_9CHLO|nr:hypothetical protein Rsub_08802 [Raphidocelis subcapitata]|eukprot:GBF95987.1 hypothetical protein Rsub_08802 [Raphidocelis subcapitata]